MSSWLGGSLSTLTGQLTNLTKDILTEGTEEISDPATELRIAQEKLQQLDSMLTAQRQENDWLKRSNKELEEKAEGSELQINAISREYRAVLESKEKEVNGLRQQHQELLEQQARLAAFPPTGGTAAVTGLESTDSHAWEPPSLNFDGDQGDWDFDDSIRLQRENNNLRSELQHWKSVAAQLGQNAVQNSEPQTKGADLFDLQHKVKSLETKLKEKSEELQQQAASLQEHHRHKLATLKARHQGEIAELQDKVANLEQRLSDAQDGTSVSQHSNTSVSLPESERQQDNNALAVRLQAALHDKKKAEDARRHLESTLAELQEEVEKLQQAGDQKHTDRDVEQLAARLKESECAQQRLQQQLTEMSAELQKQAAESLQNVKQEQEEAMANTEAAVEKLSQSDGHYLTEETSANLQQENLQLQEQVLKLQEQQALLERAAAAARAQQVALQRKVTSLRDKLKIYMDTDEEDDTDDTLNTDFSSEVSSQVTPSNSLAAEPCVTDAAIEAEIESLRAQLTQEREKVVKVDMERADWDMERDALEDLLTELRGKTQQQEEEIISLKSSTASNTEAAETDADGNSVSGKMVELEAEVASLRGEKSELEVALSELDAQHEEAQAQLINQRDLLQAKLTQLNDEQDKLSGAVKDAEISDLKEKLQKGGLVINDLHMDKQELEEELRQAREETALKVEKIKEMREETVKLVEERKALEEKLETAEGKLQEAEYEIEEWESRNEDKQLGHLSALSAKEEECHQLKVQMEAMKKEREVFTQKLGMVSGGEDLPSVEDPALRNILDGELKVRQKMEEDHKLIDELKGQVQALYDTKQQLKKDVREAQQSVQENREKQETMEKDLEDVRAQLQTALSERDDLMSKLVQAEGERESLTAEVTQKESEKGVLEEKYEKLEEQMRNQEKHFQTYAEEVSEAQKMDAESLQVEHKQLLDSHRQLNLEVDRLKVIEKEKADIEAALKTKTVENVELSKSMTHVSNEMKSVLEHISSLESACQQKDEQISELQHRMSQFDTDLNEIEDSVCIAEEKHKQEVEEKEKVVTSLKAHSDGLQRSLSQVSLELEQVVSAKKVLERSLSCQDTSNQLPPVIESEKQRTTSMSSQDDDIVSKLKTELILRNSVIEQLEGELANTQDMVKRQEQGISDLNEKSSESMSQLEKAQEQVMRQQSTIAVMKQATVEKEKLLEELQMKLSILAPLLTEQQIQKLQNHVGATVVPALEYQHVKAIDFKATPASASDANTEEVTGESNENIVTLRIEDVSDNLANGEQDFDLHVSSSDRILSLEKESETLRDRLKEKDEIVTELQRSNSSLLALLEQSPGGGLGLADQVAAHKLEADLRSLRTEKEQMVAVMTEKSRENSNLKSEVHRLMEVVAAGQSALTKLQEDNQNLQQRQRSPHRDEGEEDDMRREALANMARLVRDRETEIEALTQKNETLLAVLQDGGGGGEPQGAQVASLLQEKELLGQQVAAMLSEREQLVACVTQKHSEAVAYHAEMQRLTGLLAQATAAKEKAEADFSNLVPSFEDKSQALVAVQNDLIQCKQKLTDLEVRHGELIQRSNSKDIASKDSSMQSPDLAALEEELKRLRSSELQLTTLMSERDEKIHSQNLKLSSLEESVKQKEIECAHLRKQVENTKFQLTGLMAEIADVREEKENLQHKLLQQDSECAGLREQFSKVSSESRDKDAEVSSLREQVSTLTSLVEQQSSQGMQDQEGQISKLVRENEGMATQSLHLQRERDQYAAVAQDKGRECQQLLAENAHWKEKEFKQSKELQRLREHLIEIEDGYTREALESEEREKNLRNRLAAAEEELSSSSSQVEHARFESNRQLEILQSQLHQACAQRDAAYGQVSAGQEQTRQLSQSLANLQLVLEQFQREKDSAIATETERLQSLCDKLKQETSVQKRELEDTRADLTAALEGLEAANRLSEQLDRKEEALAALKEEVQLREQALYEAEEEIRKLNSSTEAKVDKTLLHNMVITWLTSPESKRPEIVHLIGNILSFTPDDFRKIEAAQSQGGLLSGFFRRPSASPASSAQNTPVKGSANSSFSQLFVNFLERESSPPPTPVRLPAEAMAAEAHNKHQRQPAFNPFTAPRHVRNDTFAGIGGAGTAARFSDGFSPAGSWNSGPSAASSSSSSQHHLLMAAESPISPSALFTPVYSTTVARSSESAILKDVLGEGR